MALFQRGLFPPETESKYLLPFLSKIEALDEFLLQIPTSDKVRFFSELTVQQWLEERDFDKVIGSLLYEIYNRLKFLLLTAVFKTQKLIEGLVLMYNSRNYLGWTLVGRSVLEHSAVLHYFSTRLETLNMRRTTYKMSEVRQIEDLLIQYSHGTRFNWNALLAGDTTILQKNYQPGEDNKRAVNVLTALSHLSREGSLYKDAESVYAMFSDFAHPNMASHSAFINLVADSSEPCGCELALDVGSDRGTVILIFTLMPIALNLGNMEGSIRKISGITGYWLHTVLTEGVGITFDR